MSIPSIISLKIMSAVALLSVILCFPTTASGIGIVVPRHPDTAAPQLKSVVVSAQVKDHIARTRLTQVYKNPNSRPAEADFYFPVPTGADITDFVLYMDGKPVKGEVLDKEKAHEIYRDIVRKLRDPGLIEWADKNLFRVRIFPIPANGEQKFEIEITQPLTADQGYFRYSLPLEWNRQHKAAAPPLIDFRVELRAASPVRNVYSPTHKIDTNTSDSRSVLVTANAPISDANNFILYYEPSEENIAASLLTHRAAGSDGYFSLRISPPWDESATASAQAGQYVFVIDTSGSMAEGDKIEQARKALRYCVSLLKNEDKFNLLRFSTTVEQHQQALVPATTENKKSAVSWIKNLQARGGTNISEALKRALQMRKSAGSDVTTDTAFTVIFVTDGLPTVGQTAPDAIIETVQEESGGNVRIFTFGVGNDVNTRLLDSIAEDTRAASDYVAPDTDLEVPIGRFFDKINRPALFNVELAIPSAAVKEIYPPQLPDLFFGTELAVYGKYSATTTSPVLLKGTIGGTPQEYRFEKHFPAAADDNPFIEKLWATRKVAWLLDQVRNAGESDEIRKEIEELAQKYEIVTPYTSYLAMEDEVAQRPPRQAVTATGPRFATPALRAGQSQGDVRKSEMAAAPASVLASESGAAAVETAVQLRKMKAADSLQPQEKNPVSLARQTVDGKTFVLENGTWNDTAITNSEQSVIKIQYLSEAWFRISEQFPQIRNFFALGEQVKFRLNAKTVLHVAPDGSDSIDLKTKQTISEALLDKN